MSAARILSLDLLRLRGGLHDALAQFFEEHDELVAAEAGGGVAVAHAVGDPSRDLDQQLVARVVASGLVEDLEVVETDKQKRPLSPAARAAGERLLQTVAEQATVGQLGQSIVIGEVLDLLFRRLALGDVDQRSDVMGDVAVVALDRRGGQPRRKNLSGFAPVQDLALPGSLAREAIPDRLVKGGVMLARSAARLAPSPRRLRWCSR